MALEIHGYFNALRSCLNTDYYEWRDTEDGKILLREKVYVSGSERPVTYKVRLEVSGDVLVIKLDKKNDKGSILPLFHFLDDEARPWSRRCDFVIFHLVRSRIRVYCLEFKSTTFPEGLVDQLKATERWCRSLQSTIRHYTGESRPLYLTKYVLSSHPDPSPYLDASGKYLRRDHTIRHYNYRDADGLSLTDLENANVEVIR